MTKEEVSNLIYKARQAATTLGLSERRVISSMRDQYDEKGFLSERQVAYLQDLVTQAQPLISLKYVPKMDMYKKAATLKCIDRDAKRIRQRLQKYHHKPCFYIVKFLGVVKIGISGDLSSRINAYLAPAMLPIEKIYILTGAAPQSTDAFPRKGYDWLETFLKKELIGYTYGQGTEYFVKLPMKIIKEKINLFNPTIKLSLIYKNKTQGTK